MRVFRTFARIPAQPNGEQTVGVSTVSQKLTTDTKSRDAWVLVVHTVVGPIRTEKISERSFDHPDAARAVIGAG